MNLTDRSKYHRIHFTGIKGVGMTALAIVAREMGIAVSGSDISEEFPTDATLKRFHIPYATGFSELNIAAGTDLIIYTGAHQGSKNPEVFAAKMRNIPVIPHGRALGLFMEGSRGISVAGSHGKTTTSAMVATVLVKSGRDPSYAIGCGEILGLGTSGHAGKGEFFVAEADEYMTEPGADATPRFLWQKPELLIITNIDFDHPDAYADLNAVKQAFLTFINGLAVNATIVLNQDDPPSASLLPLIKHKVVTYGLKKTAQFQLVNLMFHEGRTNFSVKFPDTKVHEFELVVPGAHNAVNATAVIAGLTNLQISLEEIKNRLAAFRGTRRRFELILEKDGKLMFDDYAHHPKEIRATLNSCRDWYGKRRLIVIFQPHTYSRTLALLPEFAESFTQADTVLVTEIYASQRETKRGDVSGRHLTEAIKKHQEEVYFVPQKSDVLEYVRSNVRPGDLIMTMGAGNIYNWIPEIAALL